MVSSRNFCAKMDQQSSLQAKKKQNVYNLKRNFIFENAPFQYLPKIIKKKCLMILGGVKRYFCPIKGFHFTKDEVFH